MMAIEDGAAHKPSLEPHIDRRYIPQKGVLSVR